MAAQKTITINGRLYDAVTGLPVTSGVAQPKSAAPSPSTVKAAATSATKQATPTAAPTAKPAAKKPAPATPRTQHASESVHGNVQKSKTLMRRANKKPAAPQRVVKRAQPGRHMDIARSNSVAKFAPHPVVKEAAVSPKSSSVAVDAPARIHPTAQKALKKAHAKKPTTVNAAKPKTVKQVKDDAITAALATPKPKAPKKTPNKWVKRLIIIGSIVLALGLILFAVYKFVPSVSVSIAASQAGIEARYPEYTPDGYALDQPVTYAEGEVNLSFRSNSNETSYSINQKRSSWDSSAVLDNVVIPSVGENYTTTRERGLTIYSYEKGAAWVNGGILYTISGDAPLSGDQIRRLATSL